VVGLSRPSPATQARGISVSGSLSMMVQTDLNRSSLRHRPIALRNPDHPVEPVDPGADIQGAMVGTVIAVEEVARRVVRAVERGDLYVLTHPEQRAIVKRRADRIDPMFEPDRW
jgi:hypothetical protein